MFLRAIVPPPPPPNSRHSPSLCLDKRDIAPWTFERQGNIWWNCKPARPMICTLSLCKCSSYTVYVNIAGMHHSHDYCARCICILLIPIIFFYFQFFIPKFKLPPILYTWQFLTLIYFYLFIIYFIFQVTFYTTLQVERIFSFIIFQTVLYFIVKIL